MVDYLNYWNERAEIPMKQLLGWLDLGASKFSQWKQRYGKVNEHNAKVPSGERPRIITDNGPQFVSRDFKDFIRFHGMTHVRTSPYYPQSNGKLERFHGSLKRECIRPACPETLAEAQAKVERYVQAYNHERLHSGIGYVTPADKLNGLAEEIFKERDRKLEEARARRAAARAAAREVA